MSTALELYKTMFLIRAAEEAILRHYPEDEMKTPMHMSMGEEGIIAGVCQALLDRDYLLGTYRSHALYIARAKEVDAFFAELYGKLAGTGKGKAGSMHLASPNNGLLFCSAIVGGTISIGVGAALASKMKGKGQVVVVFFGDGATDAGTFWESVNYASLEQLPILFVHEDNDLAVHTRKNSRHGHRGIDNVLVNFNLEVAVEKSKSAFRIYSTANALINRIRETSKPALLSVRYTRLLEHVGINQDFHEEYRLIEAFQPDQHDPLIIGRAEVLTRKEASEVDLQQLEAELRFRVAQAIARAKNTPKAPPLELYSDVFL
jgi:acetoin:2,6-dichlorophenolindophenol oxidoreductase subunit alpha